MKYIPEINVPEVILDLAKNNTAREEGFSIKPYYDNADKPNITIGYGYNLTARGLPKEWAQAQLEEDISDIFNELKNSFYWFIRLSATRQIVLIDMIYNLGWTVFLKFNNMIRYLEENDYNNAAKEMLDSQWALQVKKRAQHDAQMMETGDVVLSTQ